MFKIHVDHKGNRGWEYLPAAAGTYVAGQALTVASGKLAAISAARTTSPEYICMADGKFAAGDLVPVIRVDKDLELETSLSAAASSMVMGTKLEISKNGLEVDAAAEGTFEVKEYAGTAAGAAVIGRFL